MNTVIAIGWELRRILLTRTYLYSLLLILLISQNLLGRVIIDGIYGSAPYSLISYAMFLSILNPFLLTVLMLWCAAVFSERERAVRQIVLSTPITHAGYYGIKAAAIAAAFVLTAGLMVIGSFVFYGRQFGFFACYRFAGPLLAFLLPPAVFVLGLSLAAGRLHPRLVHGLIPLVFFSGVMYMRLSPWLDVAANNFMTDYPKILMRTLGTGEMVYYLPGSFVISRVGLVLAGAGLFLWALRSSSGLRSS
jgi:hypothetical protein